MRKGKCIRAVVLLVLLAVVMPLVLNIVACVVYDWPVELTLDASGADDVEAFLQKKLWLCRPRFRYIGYSMGDEHVPEDTAIYDWYDTELPFYLTWGAEAFMECLANRDTGVVRVWIGSSRAIGSQVLRYEKSLQWVGE